jgi:hypothetical protein
MISNALKRKILRWIHLVLAIPIVGYIYQSPSETQQYAGAVRFVFAPILILAGYWMYAGVTFAIVGVAAWLCAYRLFGFGAALVSQFVLFLARAIWLAMRRRRAT